MPQDDSVAISMVDQNGNARLAATVESDGEPGFYTVDQHGQTRQL